MHDCNEYEYDTFAQDKIPEEAKLVLFQILLIQNYHQKKVIQLHNTFVGVSASQISFDWQRQ